ncbi:MAG: DEAD/DEAH box helicase [Prevotella sp.]|nr:DEAD/DEAH box helicase [Prevotella sp.]
MKKTNEILQRLAISELNTMQEEAMAAILRTHDDVVILSPTGTGKTLAYLLPLVQLIDEDSPSLQVIVVVPGRELAMQSAEVLRSMGCGLHTMAVYGGRPAMDEHRELRKTEPQILFGTPGRLNDHLAKGNISADGVRYLVIDEFDKCLEMGFQNEMAILLSNLPQVKRRVLLSATESEVMPRFVNMGHTQRLDYRQEEEQVSTRVHIYSIESPQNDKLEPLRQLLLERGDESTVVFLNYRESVERVAEYLRKAGFTLSAFHGGLEQKQREDALYRFANGSANIMVCTDLASRGLDIPDIDNIVHYHLPETEQNYVHRIGRTARWDKQGRSFFLLKAGEHIPEYVEEKPTPYHLKHDATDMHPVQPKMVTIYIGKGKRDKISRGDIVGFLCKKGGLQGSDIGKISVEERFTYVAIAREKLHSVLKNTAGEKIKGIKTIIEEVK